MDRREHHRVQLRIPARLRWTTPFGQRTEICETLNVSRAGLLVPCNENHTAGTPLWITFPYDATLPFGQPEVLARVVRSELLATRVAAANSSGDAGGTRKDGASDAASADQLDDGYRLDNGEMVFAAFAALQYEAGAKKAKNGNGTGSGHGNGHQREVERRTSARRMLAVPIRVRLEHVPWFEETMTINASNEGLQFVSSRQYELGQH